MILADWIAIGVVALVIGGAVAYIVKAKKSGKKCIGCPESASCQRAMSATGGCTGSCNGCTGCAHSTDAKF